MSEESDRMMQLLQALACLKADEGASAEKRRQEIGEEMKLLAESKKVKP